MSYKRMSLLVLAALAAAGPASAQTRIGVSAEAGLSGTSGASVTGALGLSAAPAFSPSLSPASLVPSLAAPAAPQAAPAMSVVPAALAPEAVVPAAAKGEAMSAAIDALAPANLGKISGENAKELSARALGLDEGVRVSAGADAVPGRFAASSSDLGPSGERAPKRAKAPAAPAPERAPASLSDHVHHARLLAQNYYWYSVTHIVNMWPAYKRRWDEAKVQGAANVSRPRAFFAYMRVAAISGRFYVLGAAPLEDDAVIAKFRQTLLKWYDVPGAVSPEALRAFDDFTHRAKTYNAERRAPSNMRKHIRDALIKGSTMDPKKLPAFFDSLLIEETARETADFQNKGAQKRILDAFTAIVRETLAEEPAGVKGRVRAAILLGSFATGSAGPKSDFDVELLTDGGSNARSVAFIKRLTDRWTASGHHARNPVTVHDFPSTPSRGIIDLVHTGDFIVISLEDELVEKLQRRHGDYEPKMIRREDLRGRINRAVQYGVIVASTYLGDFKAAFGAASSRPH